MDSVAVEAANFRRIQLNKYSFFYVLNIPVANNNTIPAFLTIEEDADFQVCQITGSAYGPTDSNGVRQTASATDFPLAGTSTGYADRGLTLQLTDTGAGRVLTNGFVPVETFLSPGYGLQFFQPYPFKYWTKRNSSFRFDIRNRDSQANLWHYLSIVLQGYKYTGV